MGLVEVEVEGKGEESGVAIGNEGAAPKKKEKKSPPMSLGKRSDQKEWLSAGE